MNRLKRKGFELANIPEKKISKKIKILSVIFDFELKRSEIPAFRGAVVEKVGRENILFHNHLQDSYRYGYPLIQYKTIYRRPAMICIDHGSEEILKFFEKFDWDLNIRGKKIDATIQDIAFDYFVCGFSPLPVRYRIFNWFALNEDNFKRFIEMKKSSGERIEFLRRILIGNILSFAKGIGWHIDGEIEIQIKWMPDIRLFSFKNHRMVGFDLDFITNLLLPDYIGLGKSTARGFGMIQRKTRWSK